MYSDLLASYEYLTVLKLERESIGKDVLRLAKVVRQLIYMENSQ